MQNKIRKIYGPSYVKDFICTPAKCEETCCKSWIINVDLNTYKKYTQIDDPEISSLMKKHLKKYAVIIKSLYGLITLDQNLYCPFLNENKLCKLQQKYGESYLSLVCDTFPRISNIVDSKVERSLSPACPVAARTVLFSNEKISLQEFDEPEEKRLHVRTKFYTNRKILFKRNRSLFYQIRNFSIGLIQDRKHTLCDRLLLLGVFCKITDKYINFGTKKQIESTINSFPELASNESFLEQLSGITPVYTIQLGLLKQLSEMAGTRKSIPDYVECYEEFIKGIGYTEDISETKIITQYEQVFKNYFEPFIAEHESIFENYIVNWIYINLFPFVRNNSLYDSFVLLVLHYSLIKLHLIGMSGFHKGLTTELVVKLIYSFSRTFEHNQQYFTNVLKLLKKHKFNDLTYMSILIKN